MASKVVYVDRGGNEHIYVRLVDKQVSYTLNGEKIMVTIYYKEEHANAYWEELEKQARVSGAILS